MKNLRLFISLCFGIATLLSAELVAAQGNSGNSNASDNASMGKDKSNGNGKALGRGKNIGVGNSSDGIRGRILTAKDIFYTGDPLSISLQFTQGAELISSGEAEAWVVIFSPTEEVSANTDGADDTDTSDDTDSADNDSDLPGSDDALTDALVLPVSSDSLESETTLFSIEAVDVAALPAGTYQLGLVLTNPGGDPLNINDWYRGLLGLEHLRGLTVSDEALAADSNGDGQIDNDADDDGFSDDADTDSDSTGGSDSATSDT